MGRRTNLVRKDPHQWQDTYVSPGESVEVSLPISQSYSGFTVNIPVFVRRAAMEGPVAFVTAALHGDEINGTGVVRSLIRDSLFELTRGTLILVPVVNILGFDRHSRYLPDRRDLNRCFPGSKDGSLAARMANVVFEEIVGRCDFGIDLHTAALRRTNFPNVRADMSIPAVARLAHAFGCEFIMNTRGPENSFRRVATCAGCPTVILEAGEVWKVEPVVVEYAAQGVISVLNEMGMTDQETGKPTYQETIEKTRWVRATEGGFLRFHVAPGDLVHKSDALATSTSLTGAEQSQVISPAEGVVIGMTTLPAVAPGEPICNIALLPDRVLELIEIRRDLPIDNVHRRMIESLSTNIRVVEAT